jgi:hypothetical protein
MQWRLLGCLTKNGWVVGLYGQRLGSRYKVILVDMPGRQSYVLRVNGDRSPLSLDGVPSQEASLP